MYLIFDTETTGIIEKGANFKPLKGFPRIVQIAWNTYTENGKLISSQSYIIKPEGFEIPKTATKIHGITNKQALKVGLPSKYVMKLFINALNKADTLVAHNFRFDGRVVMAECIKNNLYCPVYQRKVIDTMLEYKKYVGKKFKNGAYKFPKLKDLYSKVFGKEFEDQHNALADVNATAKVFFKLK